MSRASRIPPFRPADPDAFRKAAPQFADLLDHAAGRLWALINSEPSYIRMAVYTHNEMPAVAALTQELDAFLSPVDTQAAADPDAAKLADRLRRAIGSMIRAVMEANGFEKSGKLRSVPPEPRRMFTRCEVYRPAPPSGGRNGSAPDFPEFDWDTFLDQASFAHVRRLSPEMGGRRPPSMYSPDKRLYYMSSLDCDVECKDEEALRAIYASLVDSWGTQAREPLRRPLQLYTLRVDITEVAGMLTQVVKDPEEFADFEAKLVEVRSNSR